MKNTETTIVSARDQLAAQKFNATTLDDHRVAAAQTNFDARMRALEARFDRDAASIRASFVAEIAGGWR
jgi:hypothetical protein